MQYRDLQTEIVYERGEALGFGATALIYRGVPVEHSTSPVAIKVARLGTTGDRLQDFLEELRLLQLLSGSEAGRHVPWAHKGEAVGSHKDEAVIILEYIPADSQLAPPRGALEEERGLAAAVQYARLLVAAHHHHITMRGDRKSADIRWLNEPANDPRLVVLDWNRARQDTGLAPTDEQGYIRQDIRTFGRLWANMLLGRDMVLPEPDDLSDPAWAKLSRGSRRFLWRALGSSEVVGYQQATDLLKDLEEYYRWVYPENDQSMAEADQLYWQAREEQSPQRQLELADRLLSLVDVLKRSGNNNAEVEQWGSWAAGHYSAPLQAGYETLSNVSLQLDLGQYQRLADIVAAALRNLPLLDPSAAKLVIALIHQEIVVRICDHGSTVLRRNMGIEALPQLREMIQVAEETARASSLDSKLSLIEKAGKTLPSLKQSLSDPTLLQLLIPLEKELAIRYYVSNSRQEQAMASWRDLRTMPGQEGYANAIRATIPELNEWLDQASGTSRNSRQQLYQNGLAMLAARLQTSLEDSYFPLAELKQVYEAYRLLYLLDPIESRNQNEYQANVGLAAIHDALANNDLARATEELQGLVPAASLPAPWPAVIRGLGDLCVPRALAIVERLGQERGWPDELVTAERLLAAATQILTKTNFASQIEQANETIVHWREQLEKLKDGLKWTNNPAAFVEHLLSADDDRFDSLLQNAIQEKIEVVDRTGLATPVESIAYRVVTIQARRAAHQLARQVKTLADNLSELSQELDAKSEEISGSLIQVESFRHYFAALESDMGVSQQDLAAELDRMMAQVSRLSQINQQLDRAVTNLPVMHQQLAAAQEQLPELNRQNELVSRETQRINDTLAAFAEAIQGMTSDQLQALIGSQLVRQQAQVAFQELTTKLASMSDEPDNIIAGAWKEPLEALTFLAPLNYNELTQVSRLTEQFRERAKFLEKLSQLKTEINELSDLIPLPPRDPRGLQAHTKKGTAIAKKLTELDENYPDLLHLFREQVFQVLEPITTSLRQLLVKAREENYPSFFKIIMFEERLKQRDS